MIELTAFAMSDPIKGLLCLSRIRNPLASPASPALLVASALPAVAVDTFGVLLVPPSLSPPAPTAALGGVGIATEDVAVDVAVDVPVDIVIDEDVDNAVADAVLLFVFT